MIYVNLCIKYENTKIDSSLYAFKKQAIARLAFY